MTEEVFLEALKSIKDPTLLSKVEEKIKGALENRVIEYITEIFCAIRQYTKTESKEKLAPTTILQEGSKTWVLQEGADLTYKLLLVKDYKTGEVDTNNIKGSFGFSKSNLDNLVLGLNRVKEGVLTKIYNNPSLVESYQSQLVESCEKWRYLAGIVVENEPLPPLAIDKQEMISYAKALKKLQGE